MLESVKESLVTWNAKNGERAKLQHAYIIVAVVLLFVAGIVGLVNRDLGQNILVVCIICAGLFLVNAVAWSLLQSALLSRLPARRTNTNGRKK